MPKDKNLKIMLFISLAITLLVPAVNYHFIYPSFTKMILDNTEEEAERAARHLQTMIIPDTIDLKRESLVKDLPDKVDQAKKDLSFIKLKLFSREGEIIYSTDSKDIREINKHDYFHQVVARGAKYTKVVKKDTKSLEGKIVKADVVETYIPIMRNGNFVGAFEIYYDITLRYEKLISAVFNFSLPPLIMMLGFFSFIAMMIFRLDKNILYRKRAETEAVLYAEKLKKSNRELEEFAYIASHDLQEPLRKIMSFGDRLKEKYSGAFDEKGLDYLERMQSAAFRMRNLIQGLLMFSRVTSKAQPFVPVNLSAVAQEVLSDMEIRIQESKGRIEVEHLPVVNADPMQMRQLMQNLISNALKFTKEGEAPVVKVSGAPVTGQERTQDNELYQITIEDNGIGFDEKYADRIFGMFQRLHGRKEYEGTGIGLTVCKKIVERHGGSIAAKSVPGAGTKFIITLPAKQSGNDGAEAAADKAIIL
ncbi:MAG: hypothetical protein C4538_05920 [Nitrospiraceae bacterium]|nr:MAG: hypothetical protein C4538_05920 [Nitrospiraceae bacterium]